MATSMGGHWVELPTGRRDWVPDDQPPAPGGAPGEWHIVGASGELGEWHWHPAPPPIMLSPPDVGPAPGAGHRFSAAALAPLPWRGPTGLGERLSAKLAAAADREDDRNSWRRTGRMFAWCVLFSVVCGALFGVAGLLGLFDRSTTDDLAAGFRWAAVVVAFPAAIAFCRGTARLIPQLFRLTSDVPAPPVQNPDTSR